MSPPKAELTVVPSPKRPAVEEIGGPEGKACPSAPCIDGALLLGVVAADGRLAYIQPPTRIDAEFAERARAEGRPEARYRFSLPCVEAGCSQWTGSGCGLVEHIFEQRAAAAPQAQAPPPAPAKLPACSIRRTCRWYAQRGGAACAVCPTVVADCGGAETYASTRAAATP
ncbi:MAG: hypothetical protein ACR2KV_00555 [Solirubrobacteraceae bacterium]